MVSHAAEPTGRHFGGIADAATMSTIVSNYNTRPEPRDCPSFTTLRSGQEAQYRDDMLEVLKQGLEETQEVETRVKYTTISPHTPIYFASGDSECGIAFSCLVRLR